MSIKKLFDNNQQTGIVGKYLKKTSVTGTAGPIESDSHLSASIKKQETYIPAIDYSDPKNFAHYGSAEKYYKNSFDYIKDYYPYGGSGYEKTNFYNNLNPLEKYIFDEKYPKSTGYISVGTSYGSVSSDASGYFSSSAEYLQFKGGPHSGTLFSTGSNRTSNLEFGGVSGSSVEFFFKKTTGTPDGEVQSKNQIVLDVWNGEATGSHADPNNSYGRMTIEILSGSEDRFYVTLQSGSTVGFLSQSVPVTGGLSLTGSWSHYAFVFNTSGSAPLLDFYVNGAAYEQGIQMSGSTPTSNTSIGEIGLVTGSLIANIGGLRTAPSGNLTAAQGWAKLSASIDGFRFWKENRSSKDIGQNWFTAVNGGSNTTDSNKSLGVSFRFNEGITDEIGIDNIFLDYSGRLSNGLFRGYNSSYTRNTGSAVNEMNLSDIREFGDPILRLQNSILYDERNYYLTLGQNHDYGNTSYLMNTMPSWIYDEDIQNGSQLGNLTQIMSNYFDTLFVQTSELRKIKDISYNSGSLTGSMREFPHNERLLSSLGLETPELFANATALERFFDRSDNVTFDQSLEEIKNVIYKNIYNNLQKIYKTKGTSKAIRNLVRCFGVDDEVVSFKTYANDMEFDLETNYTPVSSRKKYADFSGLINKESSNATIYQYYTPTKQASQGFFTGSNQLDTHAFTAEAEFLFSDRSQVDLLSYEPYPVVSSSLFGFHTPKYTSSPTDNNAEWASVTGSHKDTGLQVYAVKNPSIYAEIVQPLQDVKDVNFVVKDRHGTTILESDIIQNVYENQKWNLALTLKNDSYPYSMGVTGSVTGSYTLRLYGVNYDSGIKRQSFDISTTLTGVSGSDILRNPKKFYIGAHRENFSGTLLQRADAKASSYRVWNTYLSSSIVDIHAKESNTYGTTNPYRQVYTFESSSHGADGRIPQRYIPSIESLGMNWDFADVTGSTTAGTFLVSDFSSGSNKGDYESDYQGELFSQLNNRMMTGKAEFFPTASVSVTMKEYVPTQQKNLPEYVFSDDLVEVLNSDVEVFKPVRRPVNFYFSLEKSMYNSISNRMLQFFASLDDFNNLIGEPVNQFRGRYKNLEKLREIFFRRVGNTPDLDKYLRYYRWLDDTISLLAEQLFPASAKYKPGMKNVVESHVLERPKVKYNYIGDRTKRTDNGEPLAETIITQRRSTLGSDPRTQRGAGWRQSHAPPDNASLSAQNPPYWFRYFIPASDPSLGISDTNIQNQINTYKRVIRSSLTGGNVVSFRAEPTKAIPGDTNIIYKNLYNTNATPGNNLSVKNIKLDNLNNSSRQDRDIDYDFIPNRKKLISFSTSDNSGEQHVNERNMVPFSVFSSSVNTGYRSLLVEKGISFADLTNFHYDSYGDYGKREPLQGPFTEDHVGGIQSRHNAPLSTTERKESFVLKIETNNYQFSSSVQPLNGIRGGLRRGLTAKRPVNIANIPSYTGSHDPSSGVKKVGNYLKKYEVLQGSNRYATSMDFIFRNDQYYTGSAGAIASAYITPVSRASLGLTGSFDFLNPRQQSGARTTKVIFSSRFSAPGSKQDSKAQYRDIAGDVLAPNNALPYRNAFLRNNSYGFGSFAARSTYWGGFFEDPVTFLASSDANGLTQLNEGYDPNRVTYGSSSWDSLRLTGSGWAQPFDKIQRNTTNRIDIMRFNMPGNPFPMEMAITASVKDNYNVVRPIPSADRSQWFMRASMGGTSAGNLALLSGFLPNMYNQYVMSGSRYPKNITPLTTSLPVDTYNPAAAASGYITITDATPSSWPASKISLTDNESTARNVVFTATNALDQGNVSRSSATAYNFGVASTSASVEVLSQNIVRAITLANTNNELSITAGIATMGSDVIISLTQDIAGATGNSAIAGDAIGTVATAVGLVGGSDAQSLTYNFGSAAYSASSGKLNYSWSDGTNIGFYPSSQTRSQNLRQAQYNKRHNLYLFSPAEENIGGNEKRFAPGTLSLTHVDRAGNSVTSLYSNRFVEPPVTGRYSPLVHKIKAIAGTPSSTTGELQPVTLAYSYGNSLQGFANRKINELVGYDKSFLQGIKKRPYELLRDKASSGDLRNITGVDSIDMMMYTEKIYPKEIYTYLSGTRARLSFVNNFWKNDKEIASTTLTLGTSTSDIENSVDLISDSKVKQFNRQSTRLSGTFAGRLASSETTPFITSQGYKVQAIDQYPYNSQLSSAISAMTSSAYRRGLYTGSDPGVDNNYGFGSIWPMDSYLYSESSASLLATIPSSSITGATTPILLADAGTMAAGELMMTHYGTIDDRISVTLSGTITRNNGTQASVDYTPSGSAFYQTSSIVSSQYVYNVPTEISYSGVDAVPATAAEVDIEFKEFESAVWGTDSITLSDIDPADGTTSRTWTFTAVPASSSAAGQDSTYGFWFGTGDIADLYDITTAISSSMALARQAGMQIKLSLSPSENLDLSASIESLPGATGNSFLVGEDTTGNKKWEVPTAASTGQNFFGGVSAQAAVPGGRLAEPRSPGGVFTRPAWSAGKERKYVDGLNKGQYAPQQFPFYNTYEDFIQDARVIGKDFTIIPEFRISEHLATYKSKGSVMSSVTESLSLTGSSKDSNNSSDVDFLERYSTTDMMEYLKSFMKPGSEDLKFNQNPTHLELQSEAVIKFLPYNGFYPQSRTLEISSLFSQSYSGYASYDVNDGRSDDHRKWRPLLRPFFAPGIMFNSIKSGVGVSYPISRDGLNQYQFLTGSMSGPLSGGLSGTIDNTGGGVIPGNRRRRQTATSGNFDFSNSDVDAFFYGDVIPFEGLLKPLDYISSEKKSIISTELNPLLHMDVTASVSSKASQDDLLYRLAISNFVAATPEFFLKEKSNGHMTKFVAELPQRGSKTNPEGTAPSSQEVPRTVQVHSNSAYIMEIGLKKTDNFNMYNNPYAFGPPTATGSSNWDTSDGVATTASVGTCPEGKDWPLHRAEFAPYTAPYYYGPSLVRITYFPSQKGNVTLKDILHGPDTYVEFLNSEGHYYDYDSGSFVSDDGVTRESSRKPSYLWNRAWQNRQDIDASIIVDNIFPTEGAEVSPFDENKWVIMPKWECPILDFPNNSGDYNFSSSITPTEYTSSAIGMWHQYGVSPNQGEGVYLYLSDVDMKSTEFRLVGQDTFSDQVAYDKVRRYKKVPPFVIDSGRQVESLAELVGFKPEEVMPPGQWLPERAKRLGELSDDGEKLISEGVVAIPYYLEGKTGEIKAVTLTGDSEHLGPKLKEFRRAFTKYSFPPALRNKLSGLIPRSYPDRPEFVDPFGDDLYEEVLAGTDLLSTPVVYLFEHTIPLTKQNLADMWQGVMPDISRDVKMSYTSIDHYMPGGDLSESDQKVFPEILEQQISLKLPRTGRPRVDLLDMVPECENSGFKPEIRWLVFKVKQRSVLNYTQMILQEINDGPSTLSAENLMGYLAQDLPKSLLQTLKEQQDSLTKSQYHSDQVGSSRNTYNWPYDYCSLVELAKIKAVVAFRPNLEALKKIDSETSDDNNFNPTIGFNT